MKKLCAFSVSLIIFFSFVAPSFASKEVITETSTEQELKEYAYFFKGIEIMSNIILTEQEIVNLYNEVMSIGTPIVGGITSYAPISGGSTKTEIPPIYRTYKNTGVNEAKNLIFAYMMKKIPKKLTDSVFLNWLFVKLNSWSKISPTYVGSWVSSSYSTAEKKRNYHATVVHYEKSNYTSPKSVQYFQCNYWFGK
ncbi:hypothetical protein ACFX4I_23710 [Peribacillus sp. YIM B13472]|uniref:hypothetical protein n=1 Tax=Peribacillus TaxID=2675229 RepID=UPI0028534DF7|nr:hypothetical protein [Peribacillus simplex]MDR4926827.1 hypothetical protein [Peribacillus simplex]